MGVIKSFLALLTVAATQPAPAAPQTGDDPASVRPDRADRCSLNAPYNPRNPFARILRGEIPAPIIYQDDIVAAFLPLEWTHPGHALVVTKREVRDVRDMTDSEAAAVLRLARRIAAAQQRAFGATGFTIEQNNGQNQGVCHVHFHVIPNTIGTPVANASRSQLQTMTDRLRAALSPR